METYGAIRKERVAGFAEIIAFPDKSDPNRGLRKLADHIERSSRSEPAPRDTSAPKPAYPPGPVRPPLPNRKQPRRAARMKFVGVFSLVVLLSAGVGWALSGYYLETEQRALEAHASGIARYALDPRSPLACLGAYAGDMVEASCADTLFSTPQATAAAVSYVAAELSLLAEADERLHGDGYGSSLIRLRHELEADRFGLVAHVLSVRDRCTADRCRAFSLFQDSHKISANMSERAYASHVARHLARWQEMASQSSEPPSADNATAARSAAPDTGRPIGPKLNLPSIPPVSIMQPETPPPRKR